MANEKNKIKELVSDDDDPTAELEVLSIPPNLADVAVDETESDSHTYGYGKNKAAASKRGPSIPELQSDLETRSKTIGRLQYDIEQLRAKWLGLETEISAREEIASNLNRDIDDHKKTIARKDTLLKKRNQKLRSLKSEIEDRDEATSSLALQVSELEQLLAEHRSTEAEKTTALEKADHELEKLRSDIEERDEATSSLALQISELEQLLAEHRSSGAEQATALENANHELEKLRFDLEAARNAKPTQIVLEPKTTSVVKEVKTQIARTEEYADTLRHQLQDLKDSQSVVYDERNRLRGTVENLTERGQDLSDQLESAKKSIAELHATIEKNQNDHAQEIRTLRFELDEAQNTVAQTGEVNSQLAAELIDTRGFKNELETMLSKNEEHAQHRIEELEKHLSRLSRAAEDFEQKLDTKSTAINVLLGELAKKSEQIDSIGEIEEVIQEIDDRMSERIDDQSENVAPEPSRQPDTAQVNGDRERITRVLVGAIGDKELRFPLFKDRVTIGRTLENDIQLKEQYVSRNHAVVLTEGDNTRIIDWGSKNGVFVNSKRIKEHYLSNGDIMSIGNAKFRYEERQKRDA